MFADLVQTGLMGFAGNLDVYRLHKYMEEAGVSCDDAIEVWKIYATQGYEAAYRRFSKGSK